MSSEDKNLFAELIKNEKALIDPTTRKNPEVLYPLLSPTFFEFGCSGRVWQRPDTIKGLSSTDAANADAADFKLHRLSSDVVLLTFKTLKLDGSGNSSSALRSSIWKKNENGWQMMFHQGTKMP
ncbi:MAG: DUF4440 domain-containing protein [Bdellovibrio sp.]